MRSSSHLAPLGEPNTSFILVDVAPTLALDHLKHLMDNDRIDQLWAACPQEVVGKLRETPNSHAIGRCLAAHGTRVGRSEAAGLTATVVSAAIPDQYIVEARRAP